MPDGKMSVVSCEMGAYSFCFVTKPFPFEQHAEFKKVAKERLAECGVLLRLCCRYQLGTENMTTGMEKPSTRVIQVTNIAQNATVDQMKTLFGFLGEIEEMHLFPE